jgi:hypothetical protein
MIANVNGATEPPPDASSASFAAAGRGPARKESHPND